MFTFGFTKTALPSPAFKSMNKPARITPTVKPMDPVNGLKGITGAPASAAPMANPVHKFGVRNAPRSIQAFSRLKRGI